MEFLFVTATSLVFCFSIFVGIRGSELTLIRNPSLSINLCGYMFPIWFVWATIECFIDYYKKFFVKTNIVYK